MREELAHLKRIEWQYMVVDEAHRLKSKDSPLAADLRALQPRHLHLLTGTPLQNNTSELWALCHFLDPGRFASLPDFLEQFGHGSSGQTAPARSSPCGHPPLQKLARSLSSGQLSWPERNSLGPPRLECRSAAAAAL